MKEQSTDGDYTMYNNQVIHYAPFSIAKWQEIEKQGGKVISAGCLWIVYVLT